MSAIDVIPTTLLVGVVAYTTLLFAHLVTRNLIAKLSLYALIVMMTPFLINAWSTSADLLSIHRVSQATTTYTYDSVTGKLSQTVEVFAYTYSDVLILPDYVFTMLVFGVMFMATFHTIGGIMEFNRKRKVEIG